MKKLWLGILVGLLCVSMIGCGKGENSSKENTTPPNTVQKNPSEALPFTYQLWEKENGEVAKVEITEITIIDIDNDLRDKIEKVNKDLSVDVINSLKTDYKLIKISGISNSKTALVNSGTIVVKAYLGDQQLETMEKLINIHRTEAETGIDSCVGLVIKKEDAEKEGLQIRINVEKNDATVGKAYLDVA